jgi:putative two-component system response regulator
MEKTRPVIMLVDDNVANLTMGKSMLKDRYNIFPIDSGKKLFSILNKVTPDLILLDIEMPEMNGYDTIKLLKANPATAEIPVIFITSLSDPGSELEGLTLGAADYISKPFSPALLIKRIENHLLLESQRKALKDYNEGLELTAS